MEMVKISVEMKKKQQLVIKPIKILSTNRGRQKALTKWRHDDFNEDKTSHKWRLEPPCLTPCNSPAFLFKKFFTDSMYKLICEESIRYAISHGHHDFKMHIDEAKSFVLLLYLVVRFHF